MTFKASIVTLYPEMFPGPLGVSLAGNALTEGKWEIQTIALREFGEGKHKRVDDTPAGGGAGMVLRADVLANAIDSIGDDPRPRLLMSPRGKPLTQKRVHELAAEEGVVIVCGRFEGLDQRVIDKRGLEEVSIGDYVLSGGEPAVLVMLDAIVRLLPGVMGNDESGTHESFENGLLEHPQYTRPLDFEGEKIPEVLTSGNHGKVADWRQQKSVELTRERRPDLLEPEPGSATSNLALTDQDFATLTKLEESLWIAETRYDDEYMNEILADDFMEIGKSGQVYAREEMFFGGFENQVIDCEIPLPELRVTVLGSEIYQVTYKSRLQRNGKFESAHRSSIWRKTETDKWKLVFHQGTLIHD